MEETIYTLGLHETLIITDELRFISSAMRVPGGWIYESAAIDSRSSVFVPYCEEFENVDYSNEEERAG